MARAASAGLQHQLDSPYLPTWLRPLRLYRLDPPLCLFLLYYLITLCIHLSTVRGFTPSGTLPGASVRSAATPTQHDPAPSRHQFAPTLYPMSTKAAPAGRRLTSAQRDSLDWCAPPAQRCSTSLFLHAGANRIARLIVFRLQTSTVFMFDWLFFYYKGLFRFHRDLLELLFI